MQYILGLALFVLGVGFHIMQVVRKLRTRFPEFGMTEIFSVFLKEEWDSLFVSFLVLMSYMLYLFIVQYNNLVLPVWWVKYGLDFALALILGYAGQRLSYKYLATAEKVLERKVDNIK